jgi:hypothetical protein
VASASVAWVRPVTLLIAWDAVSSTRTSPKRVVLDEGAAAAATVGRLVLGRRRLKGAAAPALVAWVRPVTLLVAGEEVSSPRTAPKRVVPDEGAASAAACSPRALGRRQQVGAEASRVLCSF